MLFNSFSFAIFLPIVMGLYWIFRHRPHQNMLLLIASYVFYGSWDWRFLLLLIFSTLLDYCTGIKIHRSNRKKCWLAVSIIINVGFLAAFKYYNFFAQSFAYAIQSLGLNANPALIQVILPVGISFYTFHGLSYVIDIYNNKIKPESNFVDYSLFVSFFPLLVAGPIERATHLLPQIKKNRCFNYSSCVNGLRQILWGFFKKVVIADQCAVYANMIFENPTNFNGSTLFIGSALFAVQIYGDFSGYSDIALGTARLFGIELLQNFSYPYFSRSVAEFWRRWHISLTTWFRDYIYIPLGGSRIGIIKRVRNVFIIFLISGLWHGANWTFVAWGLLNALYFLPSVLFKRSIILRSNFADIMLITGTFALTCIAWVFFRSKNLSQAIFIIRKIFSPSLLSAPTVFPWLLFTVVIMFFMTEWIGKANRFAIESMPVRRPLRWATYSLIAIIIFLYSGNQQQFIYFQF